MKRSISVLIGSVFFAVLLFGSVFPLSAQTDQEHFRARIDSTVQLEKKDELVEIKTSTLFSDGVIFDFMGDNGEIIIYRTDTNQFTLIDPIRRIQTEIDKVTVDQFLVHLRKNLSERKNPFERFIAEPSFELSRNDDHSEFFFQSKWLEYRIQTEVIREQKPLEIFFDFFEAFGDLNVYLNPGSLVPLARQNINNALKKEERFPLHIEMIVYPSGKWFLGKSNKIISTNKIIYRLSEKDKSRIQLALHFHEVFPKTPFGKYHSLLDSK